MAEKVNKGKKNETINSGSYFDQLNGKELKQRQKQTEQMPRYASLL